MTLDDVLKYFGNGNKFELITGLSHSNIYNWKKRGGVIPTLSQIKLEHMTKGQLKAEIKEDWFEHTESD